jgi:hypothetical protein
VFVMQRISVALHLTAAAEISRACAVWLCWWCGGCGVDMRPQPLAGRHPTPTSRRAVWFVWLCRVLRSIVVPFVCSPSAFRVRQPPSVVVLVVLVVARICTLKHICSWSITVSETLVVSTVSSVCDRVTRRPRVSVLIVEKACSKKTRYMR